MHAPLHYGMQRPGTQPAAQGSILLGLLAGFFGGCIGLVLVMALSKEPETRKGAAIGFAAQVVVFFLLRLAN